MLVPLARSDHTLSAMKLDSKYFDMIRIRPGRAAEAEAPVRGRCMWKGCIGHGEVCETDGCEVAQ